MVRWLDERRLWWVALSAVLGVTAMFLVFSLQFTPLSTLLSASVPAILALVFVARGARVSRMILAAIGAAPLLLVAVVELLVPPGKHPEIIALLVGAGLLAVAAGFPIGLYSDPRPKS